MLSSDSQGCSDQRHDRFVAAPGARSIPPGALAGYLQAQQSWRKAQAGARHTEVSSTNQSKLSVLSGSASTNSTSSCSTSDRHLEAYGTCGLPALGCRAVARLFQRRHDLMLRHRHQRQAAKRRKLSVSAPEAPAGLLALPEDVLLHIVYNLEHEDIEPLFRVCQELRSMMHTAMLLHFTYITPHRQPYDSQPCVSVKNRAVRAQPASSSSSRCQAKSNAAPRALQFVDAPEVSSCAEQFGLMGPFDSPFLVDTALSHDPPS
ncbi:hypothetical protein ABBQ38_002238 [Trebouxia sp. C0009 RCD-2024]